MTRIMWFVCRFLSNRYVQVVVGLVIMTAGIIELQEDFHEEGTIFQPAHGVTLLGLLTLILSLIHI